MHDLGGQGLGRLHRLAFQQVRRGGHHPHQARQALGAAGARQQADLGFGQAELDLGRVGDDAVVAGQGDLQAAAEGEAVDRRGDRLAAGLQGAERLVEGEGRVEGGAQGVFLGTARPAGSLGAQLAEVGAGAEAGGLARGDHRALDGGVGLDALDHLADLADHRGGQGVHRPARHVEGDEGDAVGVDVDLEVFHGSVPQVLAAVIPHPPVPAGRAPPSPGGRGDGAGLLPRGRRKGPRRVGGVEG